eukprot:5323702-Pyramimonas_sp.AAC.1
MQHVPRVLNAATDRQANVVCDFHNIASVSHGTFEHACIRCVSGGGPISMQNNPLELKLDGTVYEHPIVTIAEIIRREIQGDARPFCAPTSSCSGSSSPS